ncbi:iron ABC transporter permease [Brevibacillus fluminis]|uniref:Iron ABC transporter permease n=1 Tax=Brevibacillus fluminis TaxID=511487 RepID=A0A3M8DHR6_9BACL|nr:iron ABC transporter permease [Brevibacillus fluminis]RNB87633.1 iron ABC transporter permease [Brevibacillus fluminis]
MNALLSNHFMKWLGLGLGAVLILCLMYASVIFGVIDTSWHTAVDAYTHFDGSNEHIVIKEVRVPRALIAAAVGLCLGMAGALLQALTRNPLADVEIFGLNSGAALAIVLAVTYFSVQSLSQFTWLAFAGAAISGVLAYLLGSAGREGITPVKLALSGAAITALFSSITHGILTINEQTLDQILFWISGSVAGRKLVYLTNVLPYMAAAWIAALLVAKPLHTLMMGEDVAKGLGQRTLWVKIVSGLIVVMLSGCSVAVAGPIGFVGLVTPHLSRFFVGIDTRWVVLYSGMLGAILLLAADIAARFVAFPNEMPIGVMTALIGAPGFVYVARKGLAKG